MSYTQSDLQDRINARIQGKIGMLVSPQNTMNEAVRQVKNEIRTRSSRRKMPLVPNLVRDFYEYQAPTDLHGISIIDIPAQAKRHDGEFKMVPSEQFRRNPQIGDIAIDDFNGVRMLLINSKTNDTTNTFASLEAVDTGPADWTAFGDGTNVAANTDDYVRGAGSIEFDINSSGGTTAGIYIDGADSVDLSDFISHPAAAYVQARITDKTNITNYKLRLGQSASAYYEYTVTTQNDGTAFANGWNELRFDLTSPTTTGSPSASSVDYAALFMTKTAGKISETGYLFNGLTFKKGQYHNVAYYSKYGWRTSGGTYIENSTDPSDVLVADTDEFELFVKKGRVAAADEVELTESQIRRLEKEYSDARDQYMLNNPSEEKATISEYHTY